MRKIFLTIITLLLLTTTKAQNFVNLDTFGDSISMQWIVDASKSTSYIYARMRADKVQSNIVDYATIDKIKQFHRISTKDSVDLQVVVCLNLWASPQNNLIMINELVNYGLNIVAFEVGNEFYTNTKDYTPDNTISWDIYKNMFLPIVTSIDLSYPNIPFIYPAAPRPKDSSISGGRNDHKIWNDNLTTYLNTQASPQDGIVWHFYYNGNDNKLFDSIKYIVPTSYNPSINYPDLEKFYSRYYEVTRNSTLWNDTYTYLISKFPNRQYWITEFGTDDSGEIRNTWAYGAIIFKDAITHQDKFDKVMIHSGIALTGVISPKKDKFDLDSINTTNVRRVEYWSQWLINDLWNKEIKELQPTNIVNVEGDNYFWFVNDTNQYFPQFNIDNSLILVNLEKHYVKSNKYYSTGGYTEWMKTGAIKSQEIKGINIDKENLSLGTFEYGYYKITTKKDVVLPINDKPSFELGQDLTLLTNKLYLFDVDVIDSIGEPLKYIWSMENTSNVITYQPSYTLTTPNVAGTYNFCLTVMDNLDASTIDCINIIVKQPQIAPKDNSWACKWFGWLFPNLCKINK